MLKNNLCDTNLKSRAINQNVLRIYTMLCVSLKVLNIIYNSYIRLYILVMKNIN